MDGTGQYLVQPEVLFTHAYLVERDPRRQAAAHPLSPLQPEEVAAFVARRGQCAVDSWDSTFRKDVGAFDVAISRLRPHITWLYAHPTTREIASRFCSAARRAGSIVVAAGPDARLRPAHYLRAGADAIVLGEGEHSTLDLVLALRAKQYRTDPELFARVPGIAWFDGHRTLRYSAGADRVVPVDELPWPLRPADSTRIHLDRWHKLQRIRPLALRSARGCPVPCGFCTNSVFGRPYRRRAPEDVVAEARNLVGRFPVDRFVFTDEVFVFDPLWLKDFASAWRASKLPPFEASAHPATFDADAVRALAAAGCVHLDIDAASGSTRLLQHLDWGHQPSDVYRVAAATREAGIDVGLRVLVGLAGETREDLDHTLQMNRIIDPSSIEVTRVDPDSPALFRRDWERVVEGPLLERGRAEGVLPAAVLDAAAAWLMGRAEPTGLDLPSRVLHAARGPLLRAAVRALPGRRRR